MTIVDALGTLRRRWYLAAAGLIVTAALAVGAGYTWQDGQLETRYPSQYETTAVVNVGTADLTGPAAAAAPRAALSLKAVVESGSFARRIAATVPAWRGGSVKAAVPSQTTLVQVMVAGREPLAVAAAMDAVIEMLPAVALDLYPGPRVVGPPAGPAPVATPPFSVSPTGEPTPPAERPSTKSSLAVGLAALFGLVLTWWVTLTADRLRRPAVASRLVPHEHGEAPAATRSLGGERERDRPVVGNRAGAHA